MSRYIHFTKLKHLIFPTGGSIPLSHVLLNATGKILTDEVDKEEGIPYSC
jgi:hypothetical protein